jgi:hypothetical protein
MKRAKMVVIFGLVLALGLATQVAEADYIFGKPVNLGPVVNNSANEQLTDVSADGLELYFVSQSRPGGQGKWDIWVSTRQTKDADWGPPENLGPTVNTSSSDWHASISADGLSLYIASERPGGYTAGDMWVTTRARKADEWGIPVNLGPTVNSGSASYVGYPDISADGLSLYFCSNQAGGSGGPDLCVTTRETTDDDWGEPVNLGPTVNDTARDADPGISSDGRLLFFGSVRAAGLGAEDIWVTRRATVSDPWGLPVNVGPPVSTSAEDFAPNVSADGSTLYFGSTRPGGSGGWDQWQAPIIPVVNFNGDDTVDLKDFSRLAHYWGQNESSVDMGPMPWGDGSVDIQDMAVWAEYYLKEVFPVELVAYWKLDEAEGTIAQDSVGDKDGTLNGNPVWQPAAGKVNGALELDGIDDYVSTPFILDPRAGAFSVFAWVKCATPGQAILSQANGQNWLSAETGTGALMSGLAIGLVPKPPSSQAVITHGDWHRVGVSWDLASLVLYVDGVEVARKALERGVPASAGGLHIGAGKNLDAGSFWSGLIDDVKVYDRAITP